MSSGSSRSSRFVNADLSLPSYLDTFYILLYLNLKVKQYLTDYSPRTEFTCTPPSYAPALMTIGSELLVENSDDSRLPIHVALCREASRHR